MYRYCNILKNHCRFVRSFNSTHPAVPHIKVEPSNYLDVDLGVNNDENRNADHEGNNNSSFIKLSLTYYPPSLYFGTFLFFAFFCLKGYYTGEQDGENGHMHNDNSQGNDEFFKVPPVPSEQRGNVTKKRKLKPKGKKRKTFIFMLYSWQLALILVIFR